MHGRQKCWVLFPVYWLLVEFKNTPQAWASPVLVLRETTERPEAIEAGTGQIVGTDQGTIVACTRKLLDDSAAYSNRARAVNPYGYGYAAVRIVSALL